MAERDQSFLPFKDFIQEIKDSDFDLDPARTFLQNVEKTSFGDRLAQKLGSVVTNNSQVVSAILDTIFGLMGGEDEVFEKKNFAIQGEVARRVGKALGYTFVMQPGITRQQLDEFSRGIGRLLPNSPEQHERILARSPKEYPPHIQIPEWLAQDEVVLARNTQYLVERGIVPSGHGFNQFNEYEFRLYKENKLRAMACFTRITDWDSQRDRMEIYTKVTPEPLSEQIFTDSISRRSPVDFIFLNPNSAYLKPGSSS